MPYKKKEQSKTVLSSTSPVAAPGSTNTEIQQPNTPFLATNIQVERPPTAADISIEQATTSVQPWSPKATRLPATKNQSQPSTPTKTLPGSPQTIIAYVQNVSPLKRNKKNTIDYTTLTLQTSTTTQPAICYSKNKRKNPRGKRGHAIATKDNSIYKINRPKHNCD